MSRRFRWTHYAWVQQYQRWYANRRNILGTGLWTSQISWSIQWCCYLPRVDRQWNVRISDTESTNSLISNLISILYCLYYFIHIDVRTHCLYYLYYFSIILSRYNDDKWQYIIIILIVISPSISPFPLVGGLLNERANCVVLRNTPTH